MEKSTIQNSEFKKYDTVTLSGQSTLDEKNVFEKIQGQCEEVKQISSCARPCLSIDLHEKFSNKKDGLEKQLETKTIVVPANKNTMDLLEIVNEVIVTFEDMFSSIEACRDFISSLVREINFDKLDLLTLLAVSKRDFYELFIAYESVIKSAITFPLSLYHMRYYLESAVNNTDTLIENMPDSLKQKVFKCAAKFQELMDRYKNNSLERKESLDFSSATERFKLYPDFQQDTQRRICIFYAQKWQKKIDNKTLFSDI